ncbi:MAG: hypothetical protein OSA78_02210 [Flavobacteriales bacterium]|nr:hypothetical protein [Flavobacteriales bacterium]
MRSPHIWAVILTLALACGSALSLISIQRNPSELADPTDFASDQYDVWEQTSLLPEGLFFADSLQDPFMTLFQVYERSDLNVCHAYNLPTVLPDGWITQSWRGGWLLGLPEALKEWEESPEEMASKWHPRVDGTIRLERRTEGTYHSRFQGASSDAVLTETTWLSESTEISASPLASEWLSAWQRMKSGSQGLVSCQMARWGTPKGVLPDSSLVSVWNGTWSTWKWQSGEVLEIWGWSDSTGFDAEGVGEIHPDGLYRWEGNRKPGSWAEFNREVHDSEPSTLFWDAIEWTSSQTRLGKVKSNQRVAWIVKGVQLHQETSHVQIAEVVEIDQNEMAEPLGWVRNHRLKKDMAVVWEPPFVKVTHDNTSVWQLELDGDRTPHVWEVDLYRNGKFQVALANEVALHIIDVLGREVRGYPIAPSSGISAAAVIDYDRNRKYRILIGSGDGDLLNYREEGTRTPGWDFNPQVGRVIVQVHHMRVGNRDYLYAGQDDGSIRLLKRSGADRFESPVSVPPEQTPCFRLSQSIASSTVLYSDEQGWIQERTFGTNEAVGMSRMTRGISVSMEDRDSDGIQEVIVQTVDGEEVWNARNERISP